VDDFIEVGVEFTYQHATEETGNQPKAALTSLHGEHTENGRCNQKKRFLTKLNERTFRKVTVNGHIQIDATDNACSNNGAKKEFGKARQNDFNVGIHLQNISQKIEFEII
jgi:hypothetical protein